MHRIYQALLWTTLGAAVILAAISIWTALSLEAPSLMPMVLLSFAAGGYALWKARRQAEPRTDGSATITKGNGEYSAI